MPIERTDLTNEIFTGSGNPASAAGARTLLELGDMALQTVASQTFAPRCVKISKVFTDFQVGGLTKQVTLLTLPAHSVVDDVRMVVVIAGIGVTTLTLSAGLAASSLKYMLASDGKAAPGVAYTGVDLISGTLEAASVDLIVEAVATVDFLSLLSAGAWDFYITYRVFP